VAARKSTAAKPARGREDGLVDLASPSGAKVTVAEALADRLLAGGYKPA
jgi:hypothetical protein